MPESGSTINGGVSGGPFPTSAKNRPARDAVARPLAADPGLRRRRRARRVIILLIGIFLLSIADLLATLTNLHTVGMVEANPLARAIIEHTSSWGLAAYKLFTVAICIGLLFRLRHHLQGEIASWLGLSILIGLTIYWGHYSEYMHHPDALDAHINQTLAQDERWLTLAE